MDQHREDPQGDPLIEPTGHADEGPESAPPVDETPRLGDPDPAVAQTVPPATDTTAADTSAPLGTAAGAGSGASALGGAADAVGPKAPGARDAAGPDAGWAGAAGGSGAGAGQGGGGGAAGADWGDPVSSGGPGAGPGGPGGGVSGDPGMGGVGGAGGAGNEGSYRRLTRRREGRMVAGVASGLARYLNVDPVILRIAFVGLTLLGFLGLVLYLLAWLMIPERAGVDSPGESLARRLAGAPSWVRITLLVVGAIIALWAVGRVSTILIVGLLIGLGIAASNTRGANGAGAAADRSRT